MPDIPIYNYNRPSKQEEENKRFKRLIQFKRDCRNPAFKIEMSKLVGEDVVNAFIDRGTLAEAIINLEDKKPVNFYDIAEIIVKY